MHIYQQVHCEVMETVQSVVATHYPDINMDARIHTAVVLDTPREPGHGEMTTNAAMALAKLCRTSPKQLAEEIAFALRETGNYLSVEVAGPGFVNIVLPPARWQACLLTILEQQLHYGDSCIGQNTTVNIEYVSANPTGPIHIGHARGAAFGDTLARLLAKVGYQVTKEHYVNDAGAQIDVLARSAFIRYRQACGEQDLTVPEGLYPGEYLIPVGEGLREAHGDRLLTMSEAEWLLIVKPFVVEAMLEQIRGDLQALGVYHDVFTSELSLHQQHKIEEAVELLQQQGLLYRGVLPPPKGKEQVDWEPREQLLFRSTDFGDDIDRALQKPDGSWTYFAADFAYALDKIRRGFQIQVLVLGADHAGYKKRMEAMVAALSGKQVPLHVRLCQLVHFIQDGQPLKMSKRAGTFISVHDVLDAVGKDSIRFMMLSRKNEMPMEFDFAKVQEQSRDNPVFYVQYAHARAKSVLRLAEQALPGINAQLAGGNIALLHQLSAPEELALIRVLATWPKIAEAAALTYEPHRIIYYVQEVAAEFHGLWNSGKDQPHLKFIQGEHPELTRARLILVQAVAYVIASVLQLCDVEPAEMMQ
jgi:arginyl-tRNA synthetase